MQIWYRTKSWVKNILADVPQEPAVHFSSATRLPQEIVKIIVGHLIYGIPSLIACSLTCYSWYIASFPHLHHIFVTRPGICFWDPKFDWPRPLQKAGNLGLLPFVKKFSIESSLLSPEAFSRKHLNPGVLRQFSTLTNVQEFVLPTWIFQASCHVCSSSSAISYHQSGPRKIREEVRRSSERISRGIFG